MNPTEVLVAVVQGMAPGYFGRIPFSLEQQVEKIGESIAYAATIPESRFHRTPTKNHQLDFVTMARDILSMVTHNYDRSLMADWLR